MKSRVRPLACGLFVLAASGISTRAHGQTYEVVTAFTVPATQPASRLFQAPDGFFYGTTIGGGATGGGTVFKIDSLGNLTTLHTFWYPDGIGPQGPLIRGTDGFFYGTTYLGGALSFGTVFRMDSSGNVTVMHSFAGDDAGSAGNDGGYPLASLVQASDGNFYGTTSTGGLAFNDLGTVFKMTPAGAVTIVHSFIGSDGLYPEAGLIQGSDGKLYGTTQGGGSGSGAAGTVFSMTLDGSTFTTLHTFTAGDGASPSSALVAANGKFYGVTPNGTGTNQYGNVYSVDSAGNFAVVKSFGASDGHGPAGGLSLASDGKLYGTASLGGANGFGAIFKVDFLGNLTTLHSFAADGSEGATPLGGVVQGTDGNFYGTARDGGANGDLADNIPGGTVFKMTSAGTLTKFFDFGGTSTGYEPESNVMQASDGNLYGTTFWGGPLSTLGSGTNGTIFKLTLTGTRTVLHEFTETDGAQPWAKLVQTAAGGPLYGTASRGGTAHWGAAFSITTAGAYSLLHSFNGTDGLGPRDAPLVLRPGDGFLYGTTEQGGALYHFGNVFSMTTGGTVTSLVAFTLAQGAYPSDGLLLNATDGNFYGTTASGGATVAQGNVIKVTPAGAVTVLHEFNHTQGGTDDDGMWPVGGLVQATDGKFYGTTRAGGLNTSGNVFRIDSAGTYATIHSFTGSDGSEPYGNLLQAADGKLYGTTRTGGAGYGTIFVIDTTGANFATLHSFTGEDGSAPLGSLIQASDGKLYGVAATGGPGKAGVVFRLTLSGCIPPPAPTAGNNGPKCAGQTLQLTASTIAGATYAWTGPNGFSSALQNPSIASATTAASGTYSVTATVAGCTSAPATTVATVNPLPSATVTAPTAVCSGATGQSASVPDAGVGATYAWAITNGTITAGSGTRAITFTAGASGSVSLNVTVTTGSGCASLGSRSVTISPAVSPPVAGNNGPKCAGQTLGLTASTIAGATYAWTGPNGFTSTSQNPSIASVTTAASGTYSVRATVAGCTSAAATTTAVVNPLPSSAISAPSSVCPNATGQTASAPDAGPGATYAWSITNGSITAGSGTRTITFSAAASGSVTLNVTVTSGSGCATSGSTSIPITASCGASLFSPLTPCRLLDTRNPAGALGGPALNAGTSRSFFLTGTCGVPAGARALSLNVTVTSPTTAGDLKVFASGTAVPVATAISYSAGQTRANNGIAAPSASGSLDVFCDQPSGTVHVIVDVNGYFR